MLTACKLGYIPVKNACMLAFFLANQPYTAPHSNALFPLMSAYQTRSLVSRPLDLAYAYPLYTMAAVAVGSCALGATAMWWYLDPVGQRKHYNSILSTNDSAYNRQQLQLNEANRALADLRLLYDGLSIERNTLRSVHHDLLQNFAELTASKNLLGCHYESLLVKHNQALYQVATLTAAQKTSQGRMNRRSKQLRLVLTRCSQLYAELASFWLYQNPCAVVSPSPILSGLVESMPFGIDTPEEYDCRILLPCPTLSGAVMLLFAGNSATQIPEVPCLWYRKEAITLSYGQQRLMIRQCINQLNSMQSLYLMYYKKCQEYDALNQLYIDQLYDNEAVLRDKQSLQLRIKKLESNVELFSNRLELVEQECMPIERAKDIIALIHGQISKKGVRTSGTHERQRHNNFLKNLCALLQDAGSLSNAKFYESLSEKLEDVSSAPVSALHEPTVASSGKQQPHKTIYLSPDPRPSRPSVSPLASPSKLEGSPFSVRSPSSSAFGSRSSRRSSESLSPSVSPSPSRAQAATPATQSEFSGAID